MTQATQAMDDAPRQRSIIRAWCMYDWANSAYATAGAAIFPIYFVFLFKSTLGESVEVLGFTLTSSSTWSLALAFSTIAIAISSPVLGVIADRVPIKKTLLGIYTVVGSFFTMLLFLTAYTGQPLYWFIGMQIFAHAGFAGSAVFYNALLPHIAPREQLDAVSSKGFAYGYIGGGLLLFIHLAMVITAQDTPYADLVTRIVISSVGLWWFGWALWTLLVIPEPHIPENMRRRLNPVQAVRLAFRELNGTFHQLLRFRVILIYLAAYLLFNDGIQTVLAIAGAFGGDVVGIPLVFNMATILVVQFVGAAGAMAFGWLANRTSTKSALFVTLAGWIVVVSFGVGIASLSPAEHRDFDYQLDYRPADSTYLVAAAPEPVDSRIDRVWREELVGSRLRAVAAAGAERPVDALAPGDTLSAETAEQLLQRVGSSDASLYSLSLSGGPLEGQSAVGRGHPSNLEGPIGWWPESIRRLVWAPLGLDAGYQWVLLGVGVGLVMGGSQALARSLFAQIAPHTRSGEFFSFFGFMSRISAVIGPILYVVVTGVLDARSAVAAMMMLIIAGAVMLRWVNVAEGAAVADAEDARHYAAAGRQNPAHPVE